MDCSIFCLKICDFKFLGLDSGETNKKSPYPCARTPPQTPPARGGAFSISPSLAEDIFLNSPPPKCARGIKGVGKNPKKFRHCEKSHFGRLRGNPKKLSF
ncbi:hypothetical protein ACWIUD_02195 [Helicobacter sp. 23-1044]